MIQSDISKRHQNDTNENAQKSQSIIGLFLHPTEKSFFSYTQKICKIVSALYLITDVMDPGLPLVGSIRGQSLDLLNACYEILSKKKFGSNELSIAIIRIEQIISLVQIGSIARHISPMNADVIVAEIVKIRELLGIDVKNLQDQEKAFLIHRPGMSESMIPEKMLSDREFDRLVERHESKRHQNDIKTTLTTELHQNDTIKQKQEIKTTIQNDIDRKQEILGFIKSRHQSTFNDIKVMFQDLSDRTIQREIAALMAMGLVQREGNKRWAVYRII